MIDQHCSTLIWVHNQLNGIAFNCISSSMNTAVEYCKQKKSLIKYLGLFWSLIDTRCEYLVLLLELLVLLLEILVLLLEFLVLFLELLVLYFQLFRLFFYLIVFCK